MNAINDSHIVGRYEIEIIDLIERPSLALRDGVVVSDGRSGQRVFTLSSAEPPYRIFVENMRDGAATLSSGAVVLYANRRPAEMISCSRETLVGSPLAMFVAPDVPIAGGELTSVVRRTLQQTWTRAVCTSN